MASHHEVTDAKPPDSKPDTPSAVWAGEHSRPGDTPPSKGSDSGEQRIYENINGALNKPQEPQAGAPKADVDPAVANSVKELIIKAEKDLATAMKDTKRDDDHRQLHEIFSKLTPAQSDALMASIRPDLAAHNLTVARVASTGEIWTGSRTSATQPFSCNAQLLEPKSGY